MPSYAKRPYRRLRRETSDNETRPFAYLDVEWFKTLPPLEFKRVIKECGYGFNHIAQLKRQMAAQSTKAERDARAAKEAERKAEIMRQINEPTKFKEG